MSAAQGRSREWGTLGWALTFLALTVQALLPILVGLEIGFADRLGIGSTAICAAAISGTPQRGDDHHPAQHYPEGACPLCSALAAGQSFITPAIGILPPLALAIRIAFKLAPLSRHATRDVAAYNSRAPPSRLI